MPNSRPGVIINRHVRNKPHRRNCNQGKEGDCVECNESIVRSLFTRRNDGKEGDNRSEKTRVYGRYNAYVIASGARALGAPGGAQGCHYPRQRLTLIGQLQSQKHSSQNTGDVSASKDCIVTTVSSPVWTSAEGVHSHA
jgi:hypothetical protein